MLFVCLFLAVLSLHAEGGLSLAAASGDYGLIVAGRLPVAVEVRGHVCFSSSWELSRLDQGLDACLLHGRRILNCSTAREVLFPCF